MNEKIFVLVKEKNARRSRLTDHHHQNTQLFVELEMEERLLKLELFISFCWIKLDKNKMCSFGFKYIGT